MTYFFVDYENVKEDGLDLLRRVRERIKFLFFIPKMFLKSV